VELQRYRAARGERGAHERRLAPEARAGGDMHMHCYAAMFGKQCRELARRFAGGGDVARERVAAVRGDVRDRPALEETVSAVGIHRGGDGAVRLGCGAEHRDARIKARRHRTRFAAGVRMRPPR
jgi:hypothetical protein